MLVSSTRFFAGIVISSALSTLVWAQAQPQGQPAQGQAPAQSTAGQAAAQGQAQPGQKEKKVKDQGEYDIFNLAVKETDPNKKLAHLNTWKEKYAETDYKKDRQLLFLDTYKNLNQPDKMIQQAKEILAEDPKDFTAMYWVATIVPSLPNAATNAEYVDLAQKSGRGLLDNLDVAFAPEKRPANTTEDAWTKARTDMQALGYKTVGWSAMVKKDAAGTKENLTKALEFNPASGEISYWLGLTVLGEKNPETYPLGLFHIARAASYDGPGALNPQGRQQVNDYLTKAYKGFHGDESGLNEVKTQAKASALPPASFKILSVKEIAEQKLKQEEEAAKADPVGVMSKRIIEELKAENGQQYFDSGLKDAATPRLRGTVVSSTPKNVVVALSDKTSPEVTLNVEGGVGKVEPGTVLEFEKGVGTGFTKDPFMLTLDIERANISGLPASTGAKKPAGVKKPGGAKRRR